MPEAIRVDAAVADRGLAVEVGIPEGATVAVVGPNGAGKSSLVQLLSGDLRPTSGRVSVHGLELSGPEGHVAPYQRRFGYVEQRALLFEMDMALLALRQQHGESAAATRLTGVYHNLLRQWSST